MLEWATWHNPYNPNCTLATGTGQYCTCPKPSEQKSRIPDFIETLDKMKELHLSKNQDYATESNPFANFDFTELVLKEFISDKDKVYVWPIACKLARLANLLNTKRAPNNESIEDSFIDCAVYLLLWKADWRRRNEKEKINT